MNRNEGYTAVIELAGSGFLAIGTSFNYNTTNTKLAIDKIDYGGDLTSQRLYGDSGDYLIAADIKYITDSSIGVLVGKASYLTDTTWIYLLNINNFGDSIGSKIYSSGQKKTNPRKFINTSDSGFAIVGWAGIASNRHGLIYLLKTDLSGNIQWEKQYGDTGKYNNGTSVLQLSDGGYFLTAWVSESASNTYIRDGKLIRLDSLGNEMWERTYGSLGLWDNIEQIIQLDSNSFAMIGSKCLGPIFNENSEGWLLIIDSLGNPIIDRHYGTNKLELFEHCIKKQSTLICSGNQQIAQSGHDMGYLFSMNLSGDSLWSKDYTYDTTGTTFDDYIWNMNSCSDGGFVLCGQASPGITGTQDSWIVKTDSNGCADTACTISLSNSNSISNSFVSASLYPNPTTNFSVLKFGEELINHECQISVIDLNGRILTSSEIIPENNERVFPLLKQAPGIYFVVVQSAEVKKVLKWVVGN